MPNINKNSTNYVHSYEPNTNDLTMAMDYNNSGQPVIRTHVDGITLQGDVIVDKVKLWDGTNQLNFDQPTNDNEAGQVSMPSEAYNMVFNGTGWDRMRGTISDGVLTKVSNDYLAISKDTNANSDTNRIYVNTTGTVSLSQNTLDALEHISVDNFPTTIGVTQDSTPWKVNIADAAGNNNDANHPVYIDGNVTVTPDNTTSTLVQFGDSTNLQMDATDRLRVSQALDTWWYAPSIDDDTNYRYQESYSGTAAGSTFVQNLASLSLSSGTDANGTFTRISRKRHKMRPATSVRVALNCNFNGYDSNVVKRAGLFTNYNGVFYQVNSDLSIHIRRRLADGTLIEKTVNRADFNVDPLDGSKSAYDFRPNGMHTFDVNITNYVSMSTVSVGGTTIYNVVLTVSDRSKLFASMKGRITGITPSTFNQVVMIENVTGGDYAVGAGNITVTMLINPGSFTSLSSAVLHHSYLFHQHVMGFDFNGNRMNKVRFFINGLEGRVVCHIEDFGTTLSTPWSTAPAMSTRYEIYNTSAPGYRPSFLTSSETVMIEGPINENLAFGTAYNNTPITYTKTQTQEFPVIGLALRAGEPYQRADLQIKSIQFIDAANINPQNSGVFFWRLLLNPTIGGTVPTETTVGRASRTWAYTSATTVSGGLELASGYTSQSSTLDLPTDPNFVNMGSNIAYDDSDKIVLVVKLLAGGSADSKVVAQMNFVEIL